MSELNAVLANLTQYRLMDTYAGKSTFLFNLD
jgi:hypothetical protein